MAYIALFSGREMAGILAGYGRPVMTGGTDAGGVDTAVIETGIGPDQGREMTGVALSRGLYMLGMLARGQGTVVAVGTTSTHREVFVIETD